MISEICDYGSLTTFMANKVFSEHEIKMMIHQIAEGLSHCHENLIAHRDIKSDNVGVDKHGILKLLDFGFSQKFKMVKTYGIFGIETGTEVQKCTNFSCSPAFASPELLAGLPYDALISDCWTFGYLAYFMMFKDYPKGAHQGVTLTIKTHKLKLIFRF